VLRLRFEVMDREGNLTVTERRVEAESFLHFLEQHVTRLESGFYTVCRAANHSPTPLLKGFISRYATRDPLGSVTVTRGELS